MIPVKIVRDYIALTDDDVEVPVKAGTDAEYRGHMPGGNVKIRLDGRDLLVHPAATDIQ